MKRILDISDVAVPAFLCAFALFCFVDQSPSSPLIWLIVALSSAANVICAIRFQLPQSRELPFHTDYASKCKRRRLNAPTPCLCCDGECRG